MGFHPALAFGAGAVAASLWWYQRTTKRDAELPVYPASIDWSALTAEHLPPPAKLVPAGLLKHVGRWEGEYTHIAPDGTIQDKHECILEIGIHGTYYSQRNTYVWRNSDGAETKREEHLFPGQFDRSGIVWVNADKISGWGEVIGTDGTVLFYGGYMAGDKDSPRAAGNKGVDPSVSVDTFDLIRIVDKSQNHRYRTWQVRANETLLKIVHVDEWRAHSENIFWIPEGPQRPRA